MQWEAPALVVAASPYGESSLIVSVMTQQHGVVKGLVKGGRSRRHMALWQPGNIVTARWNGRLAEQLGFLQAELLLSPVIYLLDSPEKMLILSACCALAEKALPERERFPRLCEDMKDILIGLARAQPLAVVRAHFLHWEMHMLEDLGYGLDLTSCAISGRHEDLQWVSPRTGRAVSDIAAGKWKGRLLPLPQCFINDSLALDDSGWVSGLRLTGHFLQKNVFEVQHRTLPPIRVRLYEQAWDKFCAHTKGDCTS